MHRTFGLLISFVMADEGSSDTDLGFILQKNTMHISEGLRCTFWLGVQLYVSYITILVIVPNLFL